MSSASSLVTTAASDTSSSADSRYYSGGARRPNVEASSVPAVVQPWLVSSPVQSSRRRSYNLKARGVVIAKETPGTGGNQKVYCVCKMCKGQRMVSKSTCYRHLRVEAEIEEDDGKWDYARWGTNNARSHEPLQPGQYYNHLPNSIPLGL